MLLKLLSMLFGSDQTNKIETMRNGADFEITKQRLQGDRRRVGSMEISDIARGKNGSIRDTRALRTSVESRQAVSYWKQGLYDAHAPLQTVQQQLNMIYAPSVGPLNGVKAPQSSSRDSHDYNTKLTNSAKQRALNTYFMRSQQEITASIQNELKAQEPLRIEAEPLMGAQEILFNLARNPDVNVRASIAENDQTPSEAMWILVEDESSVVRNKLASNLRCPVPILEMLSNDNDFIVSHKATKTLRRIWQGADASIASGNLSDKEAEASAAINEAIDLALLENVS
jgi:hypothetical protein